MSTAAVSIAPAAVEAMASSFQVVMLPASRKSSRPRPSGPVSSRGAQTSVSGKYSRTRGVPCSGSDLTLGCRTRCSAGEVMEADMVAMECR